MSYKIHISSNYPFPNVIHNNSNFGFGNNIVLSAISEEHARVSFCKTFKLHSSFRLTSVCFAKLHEPPYEIFMLKFKLTVFWILP